MKKKFMYTRKTLCLSIDIYLDKINNILTMKKPSLLILCLIVSFASVLSILFVPAFPEMALALGISDSQVQLTLNAFLIGYAFSVLPYGPISNRFGRKKALYLGASVATFGSLLTTLGGELYIFWLIVIGRFIMALGCGVGLKIAFTIIADVYEKEEARQKLSSIILAFAITPGIGIAIGGFLTQYCGWQICFYFMTVYSLFMLFLSSFLPETCRKLDPEALNLNQIQRGLFGMFKNTRVILCGLMMGCGASVIYIFAAVAPFIGINILGLNPDTYGLFNFIPPMGMVAGSFLSRYLSKRWEPLKVILWGGLLVVAFALWMLLLFLSGFLNPWTLFMPTAGVLVGFSLVYSNASALALAQTQDKANASAVMHFCNIGMAVVALFLIAALPTQAPFIMPLIFCILGIGMLVLRKKLTFALRSSERKWSLPLVQ